MKLFEHETKTILQSYQIPIPPGRVAATADEAIAITADLNPPFVVKAQVLVAGRGKAGGILFAETPEEVGIVSGKLLGTLIKGYPVKKVLVEERISIVKELYFGIAVDRRHREYAAIASTSGGIDIEEAVAENPQSTVKILISLQEGITLSDARRIAWQLGYREKQQADLTKTMVSLYNAGVDHDAELIELNPIVETEEGSFVAIDARLIVDDNALFRHPELEKLRFDENRDKTLDELEVERIGITYVKLDGNVGIIGNGAGLVMATIDTIQYYGGEAADFLDLG
ncbi:MAG TPA: ATP-grasp domain-containing protein, partial [Saprospiraceae bacterium]|nr:ATP-grasp domain-containing protein [Saprospiraceae bacterium]